MLGQLTQFIIWDIIGGELNDSKTAIILFSKKI